MNSCCEHFPQIANMQLICQIGLNVGRNAKILIISKITFI